VSIQTQQSQARITLFALFEGKGKADYLPVFCLDDILRIGDHCHIRPSLTKDVIMIPSTAEAFVARVLEIAKELNFPLETNRNGLRQIDFGHKKLHENHLRQLFPSILEPNAYISKLVENVAPGRPCTHKPLRETIARI
jgi:hypothetical protein